MKIVCTSKYKNVNLHNNLTTDKHYEVLDYIEGADTYKIINDIGNVLYVYLGEYFISLEKYRELQIDKIL